MLILSNPSSLFSRVIFFPTDLDWHQIKVTEETYEKILPYSLILKRCIRRSPKQILIAKAKVFAVMIHIIRQGFGSLLGCKSRIINS